MLVVSEDQLTELTDVGRAEFISGLKKRLTQRSPDLAKTFDDERLDLVVNSAVGKAETFGFTYRGPIRLYLDLCVAFGSGFVIDPMYPWAMEAIGDSNPDTQMQRADDLYSRSLDAIKAIHGPEDAFTKDALGALLCWARGEHDFRGVDLERYAVTSMTRLHPQKAEHGGENALRLLFAEARDACAALETTEPRHIVLTTALKFAFGAGCLTDPIYGWIEATLTSETVTDPEARFERLERRAITWLDAVVSRHAEGS